MAIAHSTGLKNFNLDSGWKTAMNTTGVIDIYTGSAPGPDAAVTGTLLGTLGLAATAFGAAASGVSTAGAISSDTSADATGTAGYWRMRLSGDATGISTTLKRLEGTVTATGGGGDMQLNSVSIALGGTIALTAMTYTHPA